VTERLTAELSRSGRQLRMLFVQPPVGAEDVSASLLDAGFRPSDALIAPRASVRLDITPPEEELVARLPRRLRTWTRQWSKRGVRVRVGNSQDISRFAELLDNTAAHHRFNPHSEEYLRMQYDALAWRGNAVLFVGEANGRPVAGELFTACGTVVTTRLCGLDRDAETLKLNVASAVTWEGIRWAKANGYHTVDFGGFKSASLKALDANPGTETRALAGPDQAKLKFGGEVVRYPEAGRNHLKPGRTHSLRCSPTAPRRAKSGRRCTRPPPGNHSAAAANLMSVETTSRPGTCGPGTRRGASQSALPAARTCSWRCRPATLPLM